MIKALAFFLLLTSDVGDALSENEEECKQIFKNQTKPRECCNFPQRHILQKHQDKCKRACEKTMDKTGGCCVLNCNYYETGVTKNQDFDAKALLELYENYLNENGAGKFDQWLPIVEKSIETCVDLIPDNKKIFTCNIPEYVLDVMDCVGHFNFLNCPNYKQSTKCDELKTFFQSTDKCGKTLNGTFIIDYTFFDE